MQQTPTMLYRIVKCPETGEREMIEYEEHPFGILTRGCSRFRPACELGCTRSCARDVDHQTRLNDPAPEEPIELDVEVT